MEWTLLIAILAFIFGVITAALAPRRRINPPVPPYQAPRIQWTEQQREAFRAGYGQIVINEPAHP